MESISIQTNYGPLTGLSKGLNKMLGDTSGRTVSMRTALGMKKLLKGNNMSNAEAEFIVHGGMAATYGLLKSSSDNAKIIGALVGFGLFICYLEGNKINYINYEPLYRAV
jgi:hypothetical protein